MNNTKCPQCGGVNLKWAPHRAIGCADCGWESHEPVDLSAFTDGGAHKLYPGKPAIEDTENYIREKAPHSVRLQIPQDELEYQIKMEPLIKEFLRDFRLQEEENVLRAVGEVGIHVDKPRLQQALTDARKFYDEGYRAAIRSSDKVCRGELRVDREQDLIDLCPTVEAIPVSELRAYLQRKLDEWNALGDRKFEPANMWGYNFIMACFDDLARLMSVLEGEKEESP